MSFPSTSPGQAGLGYLGTKVANPIAVQNPTPPRDPTPSDFNYDVGTVWVNRNLNRAFVLTSKQNGSAFWLPLASGTANLFQLTPDSGGPIPSVAGNINLAGGPGLQTVGAGNTVTINATSLPTGIITTIFDASGTWLKNANTKYVDIYMWGGGAGGGGGAKQNAGTASSGGGGGAGGEYFYLHQLPASEFPASSAIGIGAGGLGGAGATVVGTGAAGSTGGTTSVQTSVAFISTSAATAGLGGTTTVAGGGVGSLGVFGAVLLNSVPTGQTGQSAANGTAGTTIPIPGNASGGGGGGGVNAGGTAFNGGAGGTINFPGATITTGGSAGVAPGGNGGNGNIIPPSVFAQSSGSSGGGGGAGSTVSNGGNGGNGAIPGGGGGGGGGAQGAFNGGTGGTGAHGRVVIVEYS